MELAESYSNKLHLTLKALIERKSARDRKNFTVYQLAKAIDMPHSMLVKLMHADPDKRVHNPRIDTLTKIVEFFKRDGFDITVDELLAGFKASAAVDVTEQDIGVFTVARTVPVYAMDTGLEKCVGTIDVKLTSPAQQAIALLSVEDIKPVFKKGSVFIVDPALEPEHDTLVAVQAPDRILIRKFYIEGNQRVLKSHDKNAAPIELI